MTASATKWRRLYFWLMLAVHCSGSQPPPKWRHGMFIDAGSEGSRIYILRWMPTDAPFSEVVIPEIMDAMSTTPGVASFALHPEDVAGSLKPLMHFAMEKLDSEKSSWPRIPLFLRATAGMRLLVPDQREDVLDNIRTYFASLPFQFRNAMASVVTGEEEGIFGWISTNLLMGNLNSDQEPSGYTTVGALDLGGASAQIVFIPKKSIMQHAFPLHLGPHRFKVYSYSFLHFGLREAASRAASILIADALSQIQSERRIHNPCFAHGFYYVPSFSYNDKEAFSEVRVRMKGSSDYEACEKLVRRIFDKSEACLVSQCSFYGVYQPRLYDLQFLAFDHFADIAEHLAVPRNAPLSEFRIAAQYVCSLSHTQMDTIFARVEDDDTRSHLCFHATFAYTLLTYGYGFEDSASIFFQREHNGKPIDWVVGAMTYEVNQDLNLSLPHTHGAAYVSLWQ